MTNPNTDNPAYLAIRLSILRRHMYKAAKLRGRTHPMTLALSRRADEIVNMLMREKREQEQ